MHYDTLWEWQVGMDLFSEASSGAERAGVAVDSYSISTFMSLITADYPGSSEFTIRY